jgi:hypothetical protein
MAALFAVPQIADGGGWKTSLVLFNRTNKRIQGNLSFYGGRGETVAFPIGAYQPVSTMVLSLGPNETKNIETEGTGSAVTVGWAMIDADDDIGGFAIFRQRVAGRPDFEATVPVILAGSQMISSFDQTGGLTTGLALVSLNSGQVTLTLTFRDEMGDLMLERTVVLDTRHHTSFSFADRYPELAGKKGSLVIVGRSSAIQSGVFAPLGLRFNPTGSFTSVPFFASIFR